MLTPKALDKIIAYTSQLPHALAVALINSDSEDSSTGDYIGDSYRDLTRIADINGALWQQLFIGNKDNLLSVIEDFERRLDEIKNAVKCGDKDKLEEIFGKAGIRRAALNK
ncbi:MAG: prephenate dehydrogenase/arogenate dehydrogenase family protein [Clostridia bacterium]|nr:prephenate dehydrogenase/arogenate dehydrogenase family protein [Clostridia bacterium]